MNIMASSLDKEMHDYFAQLNEAEKKSVVQMLKAFLQGRKESSGPISIELYNQELEEAEKQIEAGNFVTQEQLEREMEQW